MKTVRVGEVAEQLRGVTFSKADAVPSPRDGYVAVLTAGNIQDGRLVFSGLTYVPSSKVTARQQVRRHDVVICASSGSLSVVGKAAQSDGSFAGGFGAFLKVLRPGPEVDPRYFAHYFQTQGYRRTVSAKAAGANINNLRNEHLDNLVLPLPPVREQRRIAAILDHADALRTKRRQVLAHLDSLIQSIFTEMFVSGDFAYMPAGAIMPTMRNGLSPATAGTHESKVLTLSAVTQGSFDPSAVKPGVFAIDPPAEKRITTRDFLMCRGNGNKALVGVGTYSRENRPDLVFPDTVIAGTVDPNVATLPFLEVAWKRHDVRAQVEAVARTTNGTYKVNQQTLSGVLVRVPPLGLQQAFGTRVGRVTRQHQAVLLASSADDELLASLQARAFRGEL